MADLRTIVAFGTDKHTVVIVSADGTYYKVGFDPEKGGECVLQSTAKFIRPPEGSAT